MHTWVAGPLNRYMLGDVLINIVLYAPFGMAAYSLFRRFRKHLLAWTGPVMLGAALSCCIEMIQLFEPARRCSALDVVCNSLGAAIGVFAGWLFEELSAIRSTGSSTRPVRALAFVDRAALAMLFCWVAYLAVPFFPVLGRAMARQKIGLFVHGEFSLVTLVSTAFCWFAAGSLLRAAGIRHARWWLAFTVLAVPAQIMIVFRQSTVAELFGAVLGCLLFIALGRKVPPGLLAVSFVLLLVFRGLAPFHFQTEASRFSWLPFGGFLAMDWRPGMVVLLEKLFYYGTAIWLLRVAGLRLLWAAPIVAAVLAGVEAAQLSLPGRTAEITDPLIALMMAAILSACQPRAHPRGAVPVEVLP